MDHRSYNFPLDPSLAHEGIGPDEQEAAEEALEAIRVAINNNNNNNNNNHDGHNNAEGENVRGNHIHSAIDLRNDQPDTSGSGTSIGKAPSQIERAVHTLQNLSTQNTALLEGLGFAGVLGGMVRSLEGLLEGMKKQGEVTLGLSEHLHDGDTSALLDSTLSQLFVPRSEYDELKQKYDSLLASTTGQAGPSRSRKSPSGTTASAVAGPSTTVPKKRKARQSKPSASVMPEGEELKDVKEQDEKSTNGQVGRKRRSVKLEHLVHQMANRRLGLEYPITNFRCAGSTVLPDPLTPAPPINMSANGVQEYRPDFTKGVDDSDVAEFVAVVVGDAWAGWVGGVGEGESEIEVDIAKVQEAVETYWIRLQKRWLEQQARTRGETHKDELTRKKQNQYRRQQSLVGRRIAAFESSPLNTCRLRALYRTLLTIDFAAPTNERPDPSRDYTEDQWYAYRRQQLGSRFDLGHEIVDIFWLSPAARSLLILLDTFSIARLNSLRKKGRPKAPSPTFHLPSSLWDTSPSRLPLLRPKDTDGLPIPNTSGIILFAFHVHPDIITQHPIWAQGLYDDPPPELSDMGLNSLAEVLSTDIYDSLRVRVKREKDRISGVRELNERDIREILAKPDNELGLGDDNEEVQEGEEEEFIIDPNIIIDQTGSAPTSTSGGGIGGMDYSNIDLGNINLGIDPDTLSEGIEAGLESYVALNEAAQDAEAEAEARLALQAANASMGAGGDEGSVSGTPGRNSTVGVGNNGGKGVIGGGAGGVGSSMRARKLGKKLGMGPPEGAATPVAKRQRIGVGAGGNGQIGVGVGVGSAVDELARVGREIEGDIGFLEGL